MIQWFQLEKFKDSAAPSDIPAAHSLFKDLEVQVTTGHCFLGGIIGNDESKRKFVEEKVGWWVECVHKVTTATKKSPQATFFAITKSVQCKWSYLQSLPSFQSRFSNTA